MFVQEKFSIYKQIANPITPALHTYLRHSEKDQNLSGDHYFACHW